jgi:energy-coupling factor transporter transmembrane protein EcfT
MSKIRPDVVLLTTLSAIAFVLVADTPPLVVGLGAPALLTVLASVPGRRTFGRRLLLTSPLLSVALVLRWFGHADTRELLLPVLRVVSAVAWSSCLSSMLDTRAMRLGLRALGAAPAFVELIVHTRRFASQLAETASDAWNAAALRGGLLSVRATAGMVGPVAGVVVVRAFDRAECVAIACALRGGQQIDEAPADGLPSSQKLRRLP